MSQFTLTIDLENDAFTENNPGELARIIDRVRRFVEDGQTSGVCHDLAGNRVGQWEITS